MKIGLIFFVMITSLGCGEESQPNLLINQKGLKIALPMTVNEAITQYKLSVRDGNKILSYDSEGCEHLSVSFNSNYSNLFKTNNEDYLNRHIWGINLVYDADSVSLNSMVSTWQRQVNQKFVMDSTQGFQTFRANVNDNYKIAIQQRGFSRDEISDSACFKIHRANKICIFVCYNLNENEFGNYVFYRGKKIKSD